MPVRLFYDYHEKDEDGGRALQTRLKIVRQSDPGFTYWHPGDLRPGDDQVTSIQLELGRADLIVLILSADYIADRPNLLQQATQRHLSRAAHLILIHFRPFLVESLSMLPMLPRSREFLVPPERAIQASDNLDLAWGQVERTIRRRILRADALDDEDERGTTQASRLSPLETVRLETEINGALGNLNFTAQTDVFHSFLDLDRSPRTGAFLVHGEFSEEEEEQEEMPGHHFLFHRLMRAVTAHGTRERKRILLDKSGARSRSLATLQQNLTSELTSSRCKLPWKELIRAAKALCQTQIVTFIIPRAHELSAEIVLQFLDSFWCPLLKELGTVSSDVLLFLISYTARPPALVPLCQTDVDTQWQAALPVLLPDVTPFSQIEVRRWVRNQALDRAQEQKFFRSVQHWLPHEVFRNFLDARLPEGAHALRSQLETAWFQLEI